MLCLKDSNPGRPQRWLAQTDSFLLQPSSFSLSLSLSTSNLIRIRNKANSIKRVSPVLIKRSDDDDVTSLHFFQSICSIFRYNNKKVSQLQMNLPKQVNFFCQILISPQKIAKGYIICLSGGILLNQKPMSYTNFRVAQLCSAEIKQSGWLFQVTWLTDNNQSTLFQCSDAMQR